MKPTVSPRFHLPIDFVSGDLPLPDAIAHHAVRVCRMRVGDRLTLFNGRDIEADAVLTTTDKPCAAKIEAVRAVTRESPLEITLVQALPAMDRMDTIVQKSIELGVTRIVPVITRRSVRIDQDRAENKTRHWRRLAVAACEQSGRTRIPMIYPPAPLVACLANPLWPEDAARWVLEPTANTTMTAEMSARQFCPTICLIVGSEGGFDPAELVSVAEAGFLPVRLGPRVLRTETAGPAAIAVCQAALGDFC